MDDARIVHGGQTLYQGHDERFRLVIALEALTDRSCGEDWAGDLSQRHKQRSSCLDLR